MRKTLGIFALAAVIPSCSARFPTLEKESSWADGSLSIYYFDSENRDILKSISLDGTADTRISDFPIDEYEISAFGTRIAFSDDSGQRCGVVDLVSNEVQWIPDLCTDFELSPDGESVAYESGSADERPQGLRVFLVAEKRSYLAAQSKGSIVGPRWSRDGKQIYFSDLLTRKHYSVGLEQREVTEVGESDDISAFWRGRAGLDGMHFNQWDSAIYAWYSSRSPTSEYLAECKEGSLFVVDHDSAKSRLLLRNTGGFNPDWGLSGFFNPVWTSDERYIVGEISGSIVVVEVGTGRSGIVTQGTHALAYIPGYVPGPRAAGEMYDSNVKLYGQ